MKISYSIGIKTSESRFIFATSLNSRRSSNINIENCMENRLKASTFSRIIIFLSILRVFFLPCRPFASGIRYVFPFVEKSYLINYFFK